MRLALCVVSLLFISNMALGEAFLRYEDIDRQLREVERERQALFDQENPALKNPVNTFPNIATPARGKVAPDRVAEQYKIKNTASARDNLFVFASFTMPQASLKRLIRQVNQVGGTVVFRGFKHNSWKATAFAIQALKEQDGNVVVDPNAFTKYAVTSVPTVVLVQSVNAIERAPFVAISGDVSLDYALREISRRSHAFQHIADEYLRLMEAH